ncbi:MAG TPA: dephospho-CoA kinase, partial [Isosphaeraceae bacterium]|nr:dephospho-CoA kinase [Isosphaeraceae bacterium]
MSSSRNPSVRPNHRPDRPGRKSARTPRPDSKPRSDGPRTPWKHGYVPVLGLVGGIGAGKSVVAARLAERGALVLDADAIGHTLLNQKPSREEAVTRFGDEILDPADPSKINRRTLGT